MAGSGISAECRSLVVTLDETCYGTVLDVSLGSITHVTAPDTGGVDTVCHYVTLHYKAFQQDGYSTVGLSNETGGVACTFNITGLVQSQVLYCTVTCSTDKSLVCCGGTNNHEVRNGVATTVEDTRVVVGDGGVLLGYSNHVQICSDADVGLGVGSCKAGNVNQLFRSVNDVEAFSILSYEVGDHVSAAVANTTTVAVVGDVAFGYFVGEGTFAYEQTVTGELTAGIYLLVGIVQNGDGILANVLVPCDVLLVAVQCEANLAALQLLGSNDGTACGSLIND